MTFAFSFSLRDIFIIPQKCTSMSSDVNQLIMLDWIIKHYGNDDVDEHEEHKGKKANYTDADSWDERRRRRRQRLRREQWEWRKNESEQ